MSANALVLRQASVTARAMELIIGSGLSLTQDADGIAKIDMDPMAALTEEEGDIRYVNITGDTMTGNLLAPMFFGTTHVSAGTAIGVPGTGAVRLSWGDANIGYVEWYAPDGNRQAYMGYGASGVNLQMEIGLFQVLGKSQQNEYMGRFRGWTSGGESGVGLEVGISSGQGYVYAYNRTTAAFAPLNFGGSSYLFEGPSYVVATAGFYHPGVLDTTNRTLIGAWAITGAGTLSATNITSAYFTFPSGPFFHNIVSTYPALYSGIETAGGLALRSAGGVAKGYVFWDSSGFGFLSNTGSAWSVLCNYGAGLGGTLYGAWTVGGLLTANGGGDNVYGFGIGSNFKYDGVQLSYFLNYHVGIVLTAHDNYGGVRIYGNAYPTVADGVPVATFRVANIQFHRRVYVSGSGWNDGIVGLQTGLFHTRDSYFGYSGSYRVVILGDLVSTLRTISLGVDVSGNASGNFTGNGNEIITPNVTHWITPNSANNNYLTRIVFDAVGGIRVPSTLSFGAGGSYVEDDGTYLKFIASARNFWIQSSFPVTYIYSPTIYLGDASGTQVRLQGNSLHFGASHQYALYSTDVGPVTYGNFRISGNRAGYTGFYYDDWAYLLMNHATLFGQYSPTFSWRWYFSGGATAAWWRLNCEGVDTVGSITVGTTIVATGSITGNAFYTSNWFRSTGATGWHSETYSVGIYATHTGVVRTYNGANFHSEGYVLATTFVSATTYVAAGTYFYMAGNYGSSVVGLYDSTKYQGIYAMGDAYKLALNGSGAGTLYGLAWIYDFAGGVHLSGKSLRHAAVLMENGAAKSVWGCDGMWHAGTFWGANFVLNSDIRFKKDFAPIESALDKVDRLSGFSYMPIRGTRRRLGVSAQEWREVIPEAVSEDALGELYVDYDQGIPLLIEAVKELRQEVRALKAAA